MHLFDKVPFKNLIVNGLILAADGKKMSKRLKNYPEPGLVFDEHGADALRLYLINSPAVRAEPLRFREEGVRAIIRDVLLPWYNSYRFLQAQLALYEASATTTTTTVRAYTFDRDAICHPRDNTTDAWILACLQSLIGTVREEMAAYKLYAVVPPLLAYIESLTNWYIRLNRGRLRGDFGRAQMKTSLDVLFDTLYTFALLMAPFAPLFAENIYQRLRPHLVERPTATAVDDRSVHFCSYPHVRAAYFDTDIERAFARLRAVVEAVRMLREGRNISLKTPLAELVLLSTDASFASDVKSLSAYIEDELNVRALTIVTDEAAWGVQYKAAPNFKVLGVRLKKDLTTVQRALATLSQADLRGLMSCGTITIAGHVLSLDEVAVTRQVEVAALPEGGASYAVACEASFVAYLNVALDQSLRDEGLAREVVNRVQRLRKRASLQPTDEVVID